MYVTAAHTHATKNSLAAMSQFDGGDRTHGVAVVAIALCLFFVLRWAVLALPQLSGSFWQKAADSIIGRPFFGSVEILIVIAALSIPTGVLNYIWQVYVAMVNGDGVSGYSDMDVLTFCACTAAVCVFVSAMHPLSTFNGDSEQVDDTSGTAEWLTFSWDYAKGNQDRVPGFRTVLSARTWSAASMAAFVALVTSEWDNKNGRTALILLFAAFGWVLWLVGISLLGLGADLLHGVDNGATKLDQVYALHASSATGLAAIVAYAASRMWDKFSWVEMISGNKDDSTSLAYIGAGLAVLFLIWALFIQRILRFVSEKCCRSGDGRGRYSST